MSRLPIRRATCGYPLSLSCLVVYPLRLEESARARIPPADCWLTAEFAACAYGGQEMNVVQAKRAMKSGSLPATGAGARGDQVQILPEMYPEHNSVFRIKVRSRSNTCQHGSGGFVSSNKHRPFCPRIWVAREVFLWKETALDSPYCMVVVVGGCSGFVGLLRWSSCRKSSVLPRLGNSIVNLISPWCASHPT